MVLRVVSVVKQGDISLLSPPNDLVTVPLFYVLPCRVEVEIFASILPHQNKKLLQNVNHICSCDPT